MTLVAHLTELRNRIAKALLALLVATAVAFWWYEHGLGDFIRAPYCDLPAGLGFTQGFEEGGRLVVNDVFCGGFLLLKVSPVARAALFASVWLYYPVAVLPSGA